MSPVMAASVVFAGIEAGNRDGDARVAGIVKRGFDPEHFALFSVLLGHTIVADRLRAGWVERAVESKFKAD
jgi:hypothetical protein